MDKEATKFLAVGIATMSFIGTSLGQGIAAAKAAEAVGRNPEAENKIRTMLVIGCAIAESAAIYALVLSLIILFVL